MNAIKRKIRFSKISGKSKIPYVTINKKLGKVFLNKKAIEVVAASKGDIVGVFDNETELYLKKTQKESEGYRLYSYGNNGKTLSFASKDTIDYLYDKLAVSNNTPVFRLEVFPTAQDGVFYLKLMK